MTTDVAEIGRLIAEEIEEGGHYQGPNSQSRSFHACCVITAPSFPLDDKPVFTEFVERLGERAGFTPFYYDYPKNTDPAVAPIVAWNDTTPTDEVLTILRNLDAGEPQ